MSVLKAVALFFWGIAHWLFGVAWYVTRPVHNLPGGAVSLLAVAVAVLAWWHFRPLGRRGRYLPADRPKIMNRRIHCRLRPDPGQGSLYELWHNWGHRAMYRQSARLRPAVPSRWIRLRHPHLYAVKLGYAQMFYRCWVTIVDQILILAPPQTLKTTWLATVIMSYPGPVLCTSKKGDLFRWTSAVRRMFSHVIEVFNPQELGGITSTIAWNLICGCADQNVAERRADAFTSTIDTKDMQAGGYFADQARYIMRALFHAAGIVGADLRLVMNWIATQNTEPAELILRAKGGTCVYMADALKRNRTATGAGPAVIANILQECLGFMANATLARAVLPADGTGFDPVKFLLDHGSLYMIADSHDKKAAVAPLFACMANELHYTAVQLAEEAGKTGQRMDPPFLMALDEATQICPVPIPWWLADSGSRAVQIVVVGHSRAQFAERWGDAGADIIRDTCAVKILMPGLTDTDTLKMASDVCGPFTYRTGDGERQTVRVDDDMIRCLPKYRALVINRNRPPVVVTMSRYWRDRTYRKTRGTAVAIETAPVKALDGNWAAELAAFQAALGVTVTDRAIEPSATYPAEVGIDWPEAEQDKTPRTRRWQGKH